MVTSYARRPLISKPRESQNGRHLSDFEIARRVIAIRSQWTIDERNERREEAARRFDALIKSLENAETSVTASAKNRAIQK